MMFVEENYGFATIQELRQFQFELDELFENFVLEKDCYTEPILIVCQKGGKVKAEICEKNEAGDEVTGSREFYPVSKYVKGEEIDYDLLGNTVVVPVIKEVAIRLIDAINKNL